MRRLVAALALLGAGQGVAQVAPTADVEHLFLDPAARGSLVAGNGQTLKGGGFRVSAVLQYSQGHVRSGPVALLGDRFAVHLMGAVGITRWLELSGDLPIVVKQTSRVAGFTPSSAGMATPFIHAHVGILGDEAPFLLSASVGLGIPVGSASALGNGGLAFVPRVTAGRNFNHVQLGLELGALVRGLGSFAQVSGRAADTVARADRVGSQLYLSIAASTMGEGVRGEASLRAFASLAGTAPGAELLVGVRRPLGDVELFFLAGPGVAGAPITPAFRLYGGVAFGNAGPPLPHCTESLDYPIADCPELDKDGDGVANGLDAAPLLPEDKDGFQDEDGVPDPDNDADGILDVDDGCPNQKGPKENKGCPVQEPD